MKLIDNFLLEIGLLHVRLASVNLLCDVGFSVKEEDSDQDFSLAKVCFIF